MRTKLHHLQRDEQGLAYLEFALALPFLLALLMGSIEVTRYILIAQKLEKTSVTISDLVAQSSAASISSLDQISLAAGQVMNPYSFTDQGYVIISSVTKSGTLPPKVIWQYKGAGTWTQNSQVGSPNLTASLPAGFVMADKENVIVTEVFYRFSPLLTGSVLPLASMYKIAVFRPRLGELTTLSPS